jgi:hypothetical protein
MMSEFRELLASRGRVAIAATFHDRSANASTANIDIEAREAAEPSLEGSVCPNQNTNASDSVS